MKIIFLFLRIDSLYLGFKKVAEYLSKMVESISIKDLYEVDTVKSINKERLK